VLRFDSRRQQLTDSVTDDPVLWMRGTNFYWQAGGHVLFPEGRYLLFPVSGTRRRNAVMTAVSESGTTMLWFRRIPKRIIEVVVSPDCSLTPEVLCVSAPQRHGLITTSPHPVAAGRAPSPIVHR
jgi:hypothetical protein